MGTINTFPITTFDSPKTGTQVESALDWSLRDAIVAALPTPVELVSEAFLTSRATVTNSNGTRVNEKGLIEAVPDNTPRLDYDPVTREFRGVLIEEARTNLLLWSEDFSNPWWDVNTTMTVAALASGTAPDGSTNGATITATGTDSVFGKIFTLTTATDYSGAIWIKRRAGSGTIILRIADNVDQTITVTNEWTRVSATDNSSSPFIRFYIVLSTSGDSVDIWGAQLEQASTASSYIQTAGTAVTRTADNIVIDGERFDFWRDDEGTIVAEFVSDTIATEQRVFTASDGTTSNRIESVYTSGSGTGDGYVFVVDGGASVVDAVPASQDPTAGEYARVAVAYKENDYAGSRNGGVVATDTTATVPSVAEFGIGQNSAGLSQLNGHLRRLTYYPQRLINAQIEALSVVGQDYPRKSFDPYSLVKVTDGTGKTAVAIESMNGALVERGSNTQGQYIRWADGTQIVTNSNTAIGTDPAAFVGTPTSVDGAKLKVGRWFL